LLARDLDAERAEAVLPLVSPVHRPGPGAPPAVWVSEIVADVTGLRPGAVARIPIAGHPVKFTVAGIWRDYARQNGSLLIERAEYIKLTGDRSATDAGVWLAPDVAPAQAERRLRAAVPNGDRLEVIQPSELRNVSLSIFDRTFAVTYALEAAAVVIGLFGLSSAIAGQVLSRRREFGMLRHVGMTRKQIGSMLAAEGLMTSLLGLAVGLALGWAISLVLVHVVNRQSFHWSMELHVPWTALGLFVSVMLLLATLTAVASGRHAMGRDAVRAVREDW
jgi:putative ABC transport system permease protein